MKTLFTFKESGLVTDPEFNIGLLGNSYALVNIDDEQYTYPVQFVKIQHDIVAIEITVDEHTGQIGMFIGTDQGMYLKLDCDGFDIQLLEINLVKTGLPDVSKAVQLCGGHNVVLLPVLNRVANTYFKIGDAYSYGIITVTESGRMVCNNRNSKLPVNRTVALNANTSIKLDTDGHIVIKEKDLPFANTSARMSHGLPAQPPSPVAVVYFIFPKSKTAVDSIILPQESSMSVSNENVAPVLDQGEPKSTWDADQLHTPLDIYQLMDQYAKLYEFEAIFLLMAYRGYHITAATPHEGTLTLTTDLDFNGPVHIRFRNAYVADAQSHQWASAPQGIEFYVPMTGRKDTDVILEINSVVTYLRNM